MSRFFGGEMKRQLCAAGLFVAVSLATGCASVPGASVELSGELGRQIERLEASHLALLHAFFDKEREYVERFYYEEYLPEFSRNYFSDPSIAEGLEAMCASDDPAERLQVMTILSTAAQQELTRRHQALLEPINEAERALERAMREEFAVAGKMNSAITGLLDSAVEAQGVGEDVLGKFGVEPDRVSRAIHSVDDAVRRLREGAESADSKIEDFRSKLEELTD